MALRKVLRRLDGLPVVDATKPLKVKITQDDISHAVRKDGDYCAAALALCRDDAIEDAFVHMSRTFVRYHNRWVRYMTPANLRRALIHFDKKGVFEPATFTLYAPYATVRLGSDYHTEYGRMRAERPTGRVRQIRHQVKGVRERAPKIVGDTYST